jgi:hypothetical protein
MSSGVAEGKSALVTAFSLNAEKYTSYTALMSVTSAGSTRKPMMIRDWSVNASLLVSFKRARLIIVQGGRDQVQHVELYSGNQMHAFRGCGIFQGPDSVV